MKKIAFIFILFFVSQASAMAANGEEILKNKCASCHDLKGPAAKTLAELWQRQGPDLFYAGSKYNADWLTTWLQAPKRIRPAGFHYVQNIKPGKKWDVVDKSKLKPHLKLSEAEAKAVTSVLMTLKASDELIKKGDFKGGSISASFGEMVFDKFNGCMACHAIEPNYGGTSGPEVYTAGKRLQADYMVSFIRNPQAWNPKTAMPNKHTAEPNIQKLVQYINALAKDN